MTTNMKVDSGVLFRAIEKIANTPGKNDKQALVKSYMILPGFKEVLVAALNPFITYGIAKVAPKPAGTAPGAGTFADMGTWAVLDKLAKRELTGLAAKAEVEKQMGFLEAQSAELFKRIVTKDLRAGFGESTVNKACKDLIPDFPYMRCTLVKDAKIDTFTWTTGVFSQEKADGMFANVDLEPNNIVRITTRQGNPFPIDKFGAVVESVKRLLGPGTQTHGEFLVLRDGKVCDRQTGNGIMNHVLSGGDFAENEKPLFMAWDSIPLSSVVTKGKCDIPYSERHRALNERLANPAADDTPVQMIDTRICYSMAEAMAHYAEMLEAGKEGTIIKNGTATWKDGTSKEQVKLKLAVQVELKVVGFNEGTGKNVGRLGSFQCASEDGLLEVSVNGKSDPMRDEVWANRASWLGSIVTIEANSIMNPRKEGGMHSLFLPVFIEKRNFADKDTADTLQRIRDQFESAMRPK